MYTYIKRQEAAQAATKSCRCLCRMYTFSEQTIIRVNNAEQYNMRKGTTLEVGGVLVSSECVCG